MAPVVQVLLVALVVVAGAYDILYRRIPNWLVLPCWILGFAVNVAIAGLWSGLGNAAAGFGLAMLVYFPLYLLRGMAAGDVKLMAAIGALAGPTAWLFIFIFSGLIGGVVAISVMLVHKRFAKTFRNVSYILWEMMHLRAPHKRDEELSVDSPRSFRLPHGAVIALGCLAFLGVKPFLA